MISLGGLISALVPFAGWRGSKPVPSNAFPPVPNGFPSYRSIGDYSSEFTADIGHRMHSHTLPRPTPGIEDAEDFPLGPSGARLEGMNGDRLWFTFDPSRPAPSTVEDAVHHFMDLMRDALRRGFLSDPRLSVATFCRVYDGLASKFIWPSISVKRLSMLLDEKGFRKTEIRERKGGKDKRAAAFIITLKGRTS